MYELDLYMQAMQLSLLFCWQVNDLYTFNVLLLNTLIYSYIPNIFTHKINYYHVIVS